MRKLRALWVSCRGARGLGRGDPSGARILPAYYSDNYVSLLPGERRVLDIAYAASAAKGAPHVALRGWNTVPAQTEPRPAAAAGPLADGAQAR